ncbi:response regulator [Salinarimonas sp.]|uniref:response regulator n=1 Tax=Salinarimonas sp. TaxID=2766526 RepID=UPI0039193C2F
MSGTRDSKLRPRFLVVEDEYFIADDLAQALVQAGVEVVGPVGDTEEALRVAERERLDGAVLDISLHGKMVFAASQLLRARGIPIVFATGFAQSMLPPEFADVPLWEKPFDADALARWMRTDLSAA